MARVQPNTAENGEDDGALGNRSTDHREDREALDLVEKWTVEYWPELVASAEWYRGRSSTAEDLAAESVATALSVARKDPELVESIQAPRAWLTRIVKNIGRYSVRKRTRRTRLLVRYCSDVSLAIVPTVDPDRRKVAALRAAERALPPKQLAIVRGILLDGMPDDELAESLGVTRATVRWHRHKVVQVLRPLLRAQQSKSVAFGGWRAAAPDGGPNGSGPHVTKSSGPARQAPQGAQAGAVFSHCGGTRLSGV